MVKAINVTRPVMLIAVLYALETCERPNQKKMVAAANVAIPKENVL